MKKILFLLILFVHGNALLAQNKKHKQELPVDTTKVPAFIQEKFAKEYPAITASWKPDGKNYKAFYTDPQTNIGQLIVYDHEGKVLKKESALDKDDNYAAPNDMPPAKNKSPKDK